MSEQMQTALAGCTLEEKRKLMAQLAGELFAAGESSLIRLEDEHANTVGYLYPFRGLEFFPNDPAWLVEMQRRAENPGKTYSVEEFFRELKRRRALRAKG